MRVKYVFADGREQECFLPSDFPLTMIGTLLHNHEQGIVAIEVLKVL